MTEENEGRAWLRISPEEVARLRAEEQAAYDRWRAGEEAKEEAARDAADPMRVVERKLRATLLDLARKAFPLYPIEDRLLESDRVLSDAPGSRTYFRFVLSLEASPREFPSDAFDWFQGAVVYVTVPGDDAQGVVYTNAPKLNARKRHPGWESGVDPDPDEVRSMYVPSWILLKLPVLAGECVPRVIESKVYELVNERRLHNPFYAAPGQTYTREATPVWVQFAACAVLADSGAHSMRGRYGDLGEVLDALRDDAGARDALRAACMLGGFPAVRQFVASMRASTGPRRQA